MADQETLNAIFEVRDRLAMILREQRYMNEQDFLRVLYVWESVQNIVTKLCYGDEKENEK